MFRKNNLIACNYKELEAKCGKAKEVMNRGISFVVLNISTLLSERIILNA